MIQGNGVAVPEIERQLIEILFKRPGTGLLVIQSWRLTSGAYLGLVRMPIMFKETVPEIERQLIEILVK